MKSDIEIETLKKDWLKDPCWDLENTEGFEQYKEDLKAFRLKTESEASDNARARLEKEAQLMGLENNLLLANYINRLSSRIEELEQTVRSLKENYNTNEQIQA